VVIKYRQQRALNGCHNCRHVFRYEEYDEGDTYYCALGALPRPRCGSVLMDESIYVQRLPDEERVSFTARVRAAHAAWNEWSRDREVAAWGICDDWESGEG